MLSHCDLITHDHTATELRSNVMHQPRTIVRGQETTQRSELRSNGMRTNAD
jgi:hypothetical protein